MALDTAEITATPNTPPDAADRPNWNRAAGRPIVICVAAFAVGIVLWGYKPALLLLGVGGRRGGRLPVGGRGRGRGQLGEQPGQVVGRGAEVVRQVLGGPACHERAQQIEQRRVGEDAVGLEAVALQDGHAPLPRARCDFGHQARLADACLARDERGLAPAIPPDAAVGVDVDPVEPWF